MKVLYIGYFLGFHLLLHVTGGGGAAWAQEWDSPQSTVSDLREYQLTQAEYIELAAIDRLKAEADRHIAEGRHMERVPDRRSSIDGRGVSNHATRVSGRQRVVQGERMQAEAKTRLGTLHERVVRRSELAAKVRGHNSARVWTDTQGRTMLGVLSSVESENVEIIREDGLVFTISMTTLSDNDKAYIRDAGSLRFFDDAGDSIVVAEKAVEGDLFTLFDNIPVDGEASPDFGAPSAFITAFRDGIDPTEFSQFVAEGTVRIAIDHHWDELLGVFSFASASSLLLLLESDLLSDDQKANLLLIIA